MKAAGLWGVSRRKRLEQHQVGKLLTSIAGIGPQTAACIIAELGDPARFGSIKALASYVGVAPRLRQSGKRRLSGRRLLPLGDARLRRAPWMPTLSAIRVNPWLRTYYLRLRAAGKRPKVALIAVMHKLLAAIFSVARRRQPFRCIVGFSARRCGGRRGSRADRLTAP